MLLTLIAIRLVLGPSLPPNAAWPGPDTAARVTAICPTDPLSLAPVPGATHGAAPPAAFASRGSGARGELLCFPSPASSGQPRPEDVGYPDDAPPQPPARPEPGGR